MKSPSIVKCLSSLMAVSLITQSALPAAAKAPDCPPRRCVFLPAVSRPPFLIVLHKPPDELGNGALSVLSYIHNTSPLALKEIVLRVERIDAIGQVAVVTQPLGSFEAGASVLGADQIILFGIRTSRIEALYPIITVNVSAITWTVALPTENMPISVSSMMTKTFLTHDGRVGTESTFIFRNQYSQTLRDVELALWFIDNTGPPICPFLLCSDRRNVQTLLPSELYTLTTQWEGGGYIPLEAIRVSAHGVISP